MQQEKRNMTDVLAWAISEFKSKNHPLPRAQVFSELAIFFGFRWQRRGSWEYHTYFFVRDFETKLTKVTFETKFFRFWGWILQGRSP